jgi:hypothetical protein
MRDGLTIRVCRHAGRAPRPRRRFACGPVAVSTRYPNGCAAKRAFIANNSRGRQVIPPRLGLRHVKSRRFLRQPFNPCL